MTRPLSSSRARDCAQHPTGPVAGMMLAGFRAGASEIDRMIADRSAAGNRSEKHLRECCT